MDPDISALGDHDEQLTDTDDADNSMEQSDTSEIIIGDFSTLYDLSLYEDEQLSSTPLHDGADISVMDAIVKYLSWFR